MKKYTYPALFTPAEEGGYTVTFPDLPGCVTEGDTVEEANEMAEEALSLYIADDLLNLPAATKVENVKCSAGEFVMLITADSIYLAQFNTKAVKTTITLPQGLKIAAKERNINLSKILENSIREILSIP